MTSYQKNKQPNSLLSVDYAYSCSRNILVVH